MKFVRIPIAIARLLFMTVIFPFAILFNFFRLRLWRARYKKMLNESRDKFNEVESLASKASEMGKNNGSCSRPRGLRPADSV